MAEEHEHALVTKAKEATNLSAQLKQALQKYQRAQVADVDGPHLVGPHNMGPHRV